jgi:hypothetical protein
MAQYEGIFGRGEASRAPPKGHIRLPYVEECV